MKTLGLALAGAAVAAALVAACGPPVPPVAPVAPEPASTAQPAATVAPAATAAVTAPSSSAVPAAPEGHGASTPVGASKLVDQARKLGVDFRRPLGQIPLATKKKLMPLFMRSLGYESCTGCHVEGDFKTGTRNLEIARRMWDHFVVALRGPEGAPIFCDSCHAGKPKNLDRGDKQALKRFMAAEYTAKLTHDDHQGCAACHGYPFEGRIIEEAWGIAAK